jgi:hypothetical protein
VAPEEIVFVAAAALGALKTADEEHRHADRNQHSKNASIHRNPMPQLLHLRSPFMQGNPIAHNELYPQNTMQGNSWTEILLLWLSPAAF